VAYQRNVDEIFLCLLRFFLQFSVNLVQKLEAKFTHCHSIKSKPKQQQKKKDQKNRRKKRENMILVQ